MTDEDRRLAQRLRAYESRVPDGPPPRTVLAAGRLPIGLAALAGAGLLAGAFVLANVISQPPVGDADPSPSAPTASPSPTATPRANDEPTAEPTAAASPTVAPQTPEPTPGPIVRWATAASFGQEGFAEEVRDIAYGGGHFVAIGYREPRGDRGQVGPVQHDPLIWISADGAAWDALQLGPEFEGAQFLAMATLPDGDAAIYGYVDLDPDPNVEDLESAAWRSADGRTWTRFALDLPEDPLDNLVYITRIADGPKGMLSSRTVSTADSTVDELWYSADGARWEVVARFDGGQPGWAGFLRDYSAGEQGFVLTGERFEVEAEERVHVPFVQASADGRTWFDANPDAMPDGPNLLVAAVRGDWIITQTDSEAGRDVTWFSHDGLTWDERAAVDVPPPAALEEVGLPGTPLIGTIVEGGDRAFIVGAVQYCCHGPWFAAGIWSSFDGTSWERLGFPEDTVIRAVAVHDGVTVLAGWTGASPAADWDARATFWIGERD